MSVSLKDKRILVTGASRGLGRAMCVEFARLGAHIAFSYHHDDAGAVQTQQEIHNLKRHALAFKVSITDEAAVTEMVDIATGELDGIDILVNNAGVSQALPFPLTEQVDWDRVLDTNLKGTYIATRALLPHMVRQRHGVILNIGSLAGTRMIEAPVHYCASKAGIKGFTEALCKEVARYQIRVNCLAPGLLQQGVADYLPEAKLRDYLRQTSLGRVGTLQEVANCAAFLISDRNTYMNGSTLLMDGGL